MAKRSSVKKRKWQAGRVERILTTEQKQELLDLRLKANATQGDLVEYARKEYGVKLDQSMISGWLVERGYGQKRDESAPVLGNLSSKPINQHISILRDIDNIMNIENIDRDIKRKLVSTILKTAFSESDKSNTN